MCGVYVHIFVEVRGCTNLAESGVDIRTNSFPCTWGTHESEQLFPRRVLTLKNHCRKQQGIWKTEVVFHDLWNCSLPTTLVKRHSGTPEALGLSCIANNVL